MLYLIRSFGRGGKSYLKVGYSDNIADRMTQYKIHNPLFEIISQRQGSQDEELILQMYLGIMGFKADFLNEWFKDDSEVITIFHKSFKYGKLEKVVWKNREKIFRIEDFNNPRKRKIFEYLRKRWSIGKIQCNLDRDWKFSESREGLKKMKKNLDSLDWI